MKLESAAVEHLQSGGVAFDTIKVDVVRDPSHTKVRIEVALVHQGETVARWTPPKLRVGESYRISGLTGTVPVTLSG